MIIGVDFDGTLAINRFPEVGTPIYGGKDALKVIKQMGHMIIINTCRSGEALIAAKKFLDENGYPYDYINENAKSLIEKYGDTRKISADIYIDDCNAGGFPGWDWALKLVMHKTSQKPLIFAIVGESGSGKTEMAKFLEHKYAIPMIESYTDRPRRSKNEKGHTFLSKEEFDLLDESKMIALSEFGEFRYCCMQDDVYDICSYVINEHGLEQLLQHDDKYDIVTIRISTTEETRSGRVDYERIARDKGQFVMPREAFDVIIVNDYDLMSFHYLIDMHIQLYMDLKRPYTHVYKGVDFKSHM